jgi:hypothetical protein
MKASIANLEPSEAQKYSQLAGMFKGLHVTRIAFGASAAADAIFYGVNHEGHEVQVAWRRTHLNAAFVESRPGEGVSSHGSWIKKFSGVLQQRANELALAADPSTRARSFDFRLAAAVVNKRSIEERASRRAEGILSIKKDVHDAMRGIGEPSRHEDKVKELVGRFAAGFLSQMDTGLIEKDRADMRRDAFNQIMKEKPHNNPIWNLLFG